MGKHHEADYKKYACRLVIEEEQKIAEVSRHLTIPYGTLRRWIREYKKALQEPELSNQEAKEILKQQQYQTPSDFKKQLKEKEKKIKKLHEENEILKKAMHVFTKSRE